MKHRSDRTRDRRELALAATLVIALLLAAIAAVDALGRGPGQEPASWAERLRAAEAARAAGNSRGVARELAAAHIAALASDGWEGLLAVGDASLRLTQGPVTSALPRARKAYLTALFRARGRDSVEGALRAAEAFAAIGDRDGALHAVAVAHEVAARRRDTRALTSVNTLYERLLESTSDSSEVRAD